MYKKFLICFSVLFSVLPAYALQSKIEIKAGFPNVSKIKSAPDNQLLLAVGSFDPLYEELDFTSTKILTKPSARYKIIQFHSGHADSEWLVKQGVKVLSYLPNNAFIIADNKYSKNLESNKNVRWQGYYLSNYKIHPDLWESHIKHKVKYKLMISVFKDYPKDKIQLLLRKYIPDIHFIDMPGKHEVFIEVDNKDIYNTINTLASVDQIQFVEPVKPLKTFNAEAVSAVQGNINSNGSAINDDYVPSHTPIWDKGLLGSGQIVGVSDGGLDSNEDWFAHYDNGSTVTHEVTEAEFTTPPNPGTIYPDRKVIGYFTMPGAIHYDATGHGTHVTGSVAGDRLASIGTGPAGSISSPTDPGYDNDDGMAPNAQILFQDIGGEDGDGEPALSGQGSYPMWQQAFNAGVRIHSNSYGSEGDGAYSFSDLFLDDHLRNYEDMLIVFAAGNDGPTNNTTSSPGNAKNALTIGALGHGNLRDPATFSGRGPTDDGRIKPDIMATGSNIESAENDEENGNAISPPTRTTKSGTSMATPITSGASALMRQYYTDGYYPTGIANAADEHIPTGALMKATLINGANTDAGHFDENVGWGRVKLTNSIMFDDSDKQMRVWEMENENGLKTGQSVEFKLGSCSRPGFGCDIDLV